MNIIKGLDRIAIVLAAVAIIPGFFIGSIGYEDLKTKKEFVRYNVEKEKDPPVSPPAKTTIRVDEKGNVTRHLSTPSNDPFNYRPIVTTGEWKIVYKPPVWQSFIVGIASSISIFLIVLFGFRGTARAIKTFYLWIINGFKEN
jgi:hypothetical protein